jgi:hypothetical protein
MLICKVQEVDDLTDSGILDYDHVLWEDFEKGQYASLRVEPSVSIKLCNNIITFFCIGYRDLIILPTPKS